MVSTRSRKAAKSPPRAVKGLVQKPKRKKVDAARPRPGPRPSQSERVAHIKAITGSVPRRPRSGSASHLRDIEKALENKFRKRYGHRTKCQQVGDLIKCVGVAGAGVAVAALSVAAATKWYADRNMAAKLKRINFKNGDIWQNIESFRREMKFE